MKLKNKAIRNLVITFCFAVLSLGFTSQIINSQVKPLSLAQILTGLQSRSGGFTMAQKNDFLVKKVQSSGITFKLSPDIESELKIAGASTALINAIRLKSRGTRTTPTPVNTPDEDKPNADYEKIWVEQNVVENNVSGIRIYATFNVYNLKDVSSDIVYRFQKDGAFLKGKNEEYSTKSGDLSTRRLLKPNYSATVYEELDAFIPYSEFGLGSGTHNLKLDADVILRDGTMVKHLVLQDLQLVIPGSSSKGSAEFDKMWIDYNVKENGKTGMTVHTKVTVRDLKDQDIYLQLLFEKEDGTKLYSTNSLYKDPNGQTAAYKLIRPIYESALFHDIAVFIPYDEFNLPVGSYKLRVHADLIMPDYTTIQHLSYYPFTYSRSR